MSNNLLNRHYVIMPMPQPPEAWEVTLEKRPIVVSLDGTKVLMKFSGPTPPYFAGVTTYTNPEILEILAGPEWTDPDHEDPTP